MVAAVVLPRGCQRMLVFNKFMKVVYLFTTYCNLVVSFSGLDPFLYQMLDQCFFNYIPMIR